MAWVIEFDAKAKKDFLKLDKVAQNQIDKFLLKLIKLDNPRQIGQALKGKFISFWKYRIGSYRLICNIEDKNVIILVLKVDHRKQVYK